MEMVKQVIQREGGKGDPGPLIFGTMKTGAFSTNAQSKFASIVLDGVLGLPCLARHTFDGVLVSL